MTDSPARTHAQSAEVERVTGVRLVPKAGTQVMSVEYRIQWKDGTVQTWCVASGGGEQLGVVSACAGCVVLTPALCRLPCREPARNVADDVLRDFEARWWGAARKGDTDTLTDMLAGGKEVLATTVDDNKRTCVPLAGVLVCSGVLTPTHAHRALHFACGIGSEPCVRLLLENGADVGAQVRGAGWALGILLID